MKIDCDSLLLVNCLECLISVKYYVIKCIAFFFLFKKNSTFVLYVRLMINLGFCLSRDFN